MVGVAGGGGQSALGVVAGDGDVVVDRAAEERREAVGGDGVAPRR
jgi:hypothetical protein